MDLNTKNKQRPQSFLYPVCSILNTRWASLIHYIYQMKILIRFLFLIVLIFGAFNLSAQDVIQKDSIAINLDSVYTKVDVVAEYPGGDKERRDFYKSRLRGQIPTENLAPPGTYTVVVVCIIGADGKLIAAIPQTNHGFGMVEEVIRVTKKLPTPFKPAYKNGVPVKSKMKFTIGFYVAEKKTSDF